MIAQALLSLLLINQAPVYQDGCNVTYKNQTVTYKSWKVAADVARNLQKNTFAEPGKTIFWNVEADYARNPSLGVSPRVRYITEYVIPNMVANDSTSGLSRVQQAELNYKIGYNRSKNKRLLNEIPKNSKGAK